MDAMTAQVIYALTLLALLILFIVVFIPPARRRDYESLETLRRVYARGPMKFDPKTGCYYLTPEQEKTFAEDHTRNLAVKENRKHRFVYWKESVLMMFGRKKYDFDFEALRDTNKTRQPTKPVGAP